MLALYQVIWQSLCGSWGNMASSKLTRALLPPISSAGTPRCMKPLPRSSAAACTAPVHTRYNTNHNNPVRTASQLSRHDVLASQQSPPQAMHCHSSQNNCTPSGPTVQPLWRLLLRAVALDAPVDVHVAHAQRWVLAGSNLFVIEDHPAAVLQPCRTTKSPWIAIIKAHAWQSGSTVIPQDSCCNQCSKQWRMKYAGISCLGTLGVTQRQVWLVARHSTRNTDCQICEPVIQRKMGHCWMPETLCWQQAACVLPTFLTCAT